MNEPRGCFQYDCLRDKQYDDALREMEQRLHGWTPVVEKLPPEGERVFVYIEHPVYGREKTYKRNITAGKVIDGKWHLDFAVGVKPLAWMKPVLPKGVESNEID